MVPSDGLDLMESKETSNFVWNFIQLSSPYFYCVEKNKRRKTYSMHGKIRHVHSFGEEENFSGRDSGLD